MYIRMKPNSYFSLCTKVNERIRNLKLLKYLRKTFQNAAIDKNFLKRAPKVEGIITIELHLKSSV